jgi:protein-S-isoprenylcysteine O-methyltransferase Ste14
MNDEAPFRLAILIGLCLGMPIAVYHRIRSQAAGDRLDRFQEGLFILITLRLAGLMCWGFVIAYLINPEWMAWAALPLPGWLRWAGAIPFAAGFALLGWAFHSLGPNLTDTVVTRAGHTLVTAGPYRFVRHPFYGSVALLMTGLALLSASAAIAACGVLLLTLLILRTPIEERKLIERFGDAYREYMARTGRFLPRWRS